MGQYCRNSARWGRFQFRIYGAWCRYSPNECESNPSAGLDSPWNLGTRPLLRRESFNDRSYAPCRCVSLGGCGAYGLEYPRLWSDRWRVRSACVGCRRYQQGARGRTESARRIRKTKLERISYLFYGLYAKLYSDIFLIRMAATL